jgi:hypothetical protein
MCHCDDVYLDCSVRSLFSLTLRRSDDGEHRDQEDHLNFAGKKPILFTGLQIALCVLAGDMKKARREK